MQSSYINVSKIVSIHYYEFNQSFTFSGEKHNSWEIVYVDSGCVEIIRDTETVILKQGDIIFHKPNEFHAIKSYNSCPNVFVISFVCKSAPMEDFNHFRTSLNKNLKPFIASIIDEAERTYHIPKNDISFKKLAFKSNAPIGGDQLIKTYLEQFLIFLARENASKHELSVFPSKENLAPQLVIDIKDYINSHITSNLRMDDICTFFGYSKTYICQLFKAYCSVSVMKYCNIKKIDYAKKMIRENRYNITQISNHLSFDNPQYFSRVFKRITGITPTEFANSLEIKH